MSNIIIFSFSLFLIVHFTTSLQKVDFSNSTSGDIDENILCRGCGNEITFTRNLISKTSITSLYSFTDSIFKKDAVLIQVLTTDFFFPYPVITTSKSSCIGIAEWEETDSWFPGYRWRPCVCPDCGALVGWIFEPLNPSLVDPPTTFFALILPSLISESCKYSYLGDMVLCVWGFVLSCRISVMQLWVYVLSCLCRIK